MALNVAVELPGSLLAQHKPGSTGRARDRQRHQRLLWRVEMAVGMRQCANKGVECWCKVARLGQTELADRIADLLLVMPALGVLARQVEPDRRRIRAGPIDWAAQRIGIERLKECRHLRASQPQH